jgi:hypothetical protein
VPSNHITVPFAIPVSATTSAPSVPVMAGPRLKGSVCLRMVFSAQLPALNEKTRMLRVDSVPVEVADCAAS